MMRRFLTDNLLSVLSLCAGAALFFVIAPVLGISLYLAPIGLILGLSAGAICYVWLQRVRPEDEHLASVSSTDSSSQFQRLKKVSPLKIRRRAKGVTQTKMIRRSKRIHLAKTEPESKGVKVENVTSEPVKR